jgi:FtsP/CotA-like multicopper oxidase with cupredoxin domain
MKSRNNTAKTARRKTFTRRELIKWGLVSGTASMFHLNRLKADDGGDGPTSPATTPFVQELPAPPEPDPVMPFSTPDCQPIINGNTRFYNLIEEERFVKFHPSLPPTSIWGYRDATRPTWPFGPGPTFKARMNHGNIVRFTNNLPINHHGFGEPRTTVHLHGGHHEARSDGFPILDFSPGESYDYCYPMLDHGFSHGAPEVDERPAVNWYHDHLLDFTGPNVYRGLAGLYLVFDELDSGNENDMTPGALRLPSGNFDIPMIVQDKRFNRDGSLFFDQFNTDGFLGDKFVVNGAIQPFLRVKRRKYRLRFWNASNARFFQLFFSRANGQTCTFDQIGNDGGLFSHPIRGQTNFQFGSAERIDLVIDFRQCRSGDELFLENRLRQDDGRKPNELQSRGPGILKFIIEEEVPDPSLVPDTLRQVIPIPQSVLNAAVRRTLEFERRHGAWAINGQLVDLNKALVSAGENVPQIYRLVNKSGGWWHPIHFHLDFMRVLSREGQLPPLDERDGNAKRDTVTLRDNSVVEVFLRFTDYPGSYVFHCHNLEHEDMFMMGRLDVV